MDAWLIASLVFLFVLTLTALFNIIFGPNLKNAPPPAGNPSVSLLVPARNEAENIKRCLDSLLHQEYPVQEIIVLNDESTDSTLQIAQSMQRIHSKVTVISGSPLPEEWTGKNWACHQLQQAATSDILIFTDADTWHEKAAVKNTVGWMQKLNLGFLSVFPQQITKTFPEKLVIPLLDILIYALLPLWSTFKLKSPYFAAANGQWIAFTREAYNLTGGHKSVQNQIVEDVELSRLVKRTGIQMLTLSGTGNVFCRMYKNSREIWEGLSKNLFGLTGFNFFLLLGLLTGLTLAFIFPYFIILSQSAFGLGIIAVLNGLFLRLIISLRYNQFSISTLLLTPVSFFILCIISINSFRISRFGKIPWKNRLIKINKNNNSATFRNN